MRTSTLLAAGTALLALSVAVASAVAEPITFGPRSSSAGGELARSTDTSNAVLEGTFPFNETIIAAVAPVSPGTAECPTDLPENAVKAQLMLTNQGLWTFDGRGNLSITDTGVSTTLSAQSSSPSLDVSFSQANCKGRYQTKSDSTVDMDYTCVVAGGAVEFDVHAKGLITRSNILVSVPPAAGGKLRLTPEYLVSNGTRTLAACVAVGENTTISR